MNDRTPVIHIKPRRSLYLALWSVFVYLLAMLAVGLLQVDSRLRLLLILGLLLRLIWLLYRHLSIDSAAVVSQAQYMNGDEWRLILGNGKELKARLSDQSFVTPWLMILNFRIARFVPGKTLVLFPDSLEPPTARRLRIHLKGSRRSGTQIPP